MKLGPLLTGVTVTKMFQTMFGRMVTTHDVEIHRVRTDSRTVGPGDMFVAVRGTLTDGHAHVHAAVQAGAKAVMVERDDAISDPQCMHSGVVKIVVPDSRRALSVIAANINGRPADAMKVVGVTGTNGKTTTAHIVRSILDAGGERTGLIGTIDVRYADAVEPATHTTPDPVALHELFGRMRSKGCTAVSMEVSSHALDQRRVDGIPFACGILTNITQDHLDYHGTMDRYIEAKKLLFDGLPASASAVVNADDPATERMTKDCRAHLITYGSKRDALVRLVSADVSVSGNTIVVGYEGANVTLTSPLAGRFNVENVIAGFAAGIALGIRVPAIELGIASMPGVRGRFERVPSSTGWTAIIDYAHTPDALDKCLRTVREMMPKEGSGRVITVFGAGGDRDRTKRPLMGKAAAALSDVVIVTSDNPRTEQPEAIIADVVKGIPTGGDVRTEPDRRKAIAMAAAEARTGDIIVIAGKGHEEVQVIGHERIRFSDREEVERLT